MIATEAFIYGTPRLFAHLSIMFSWFLKFGVLPAKFTQSTIVPLVKLNVEIFLMLTTIEL